MNPRLFNEFEHHGLIEKRYVSVQRPNQKSRFETGLGPNTLLFHTVLDVATKSLDANEIVPFNVRRIILARSTTSSIICFRFARLNHVLFWLFLKESRCA